MQVLLSLTFLLQKKALVSKHVLKIKQKSTDVFILSLEILNSVSRKNQAVRIIKGKHCIMLRW